jgi:hypothetical protein
MQEVIMMQDERRRHRRYRVKDNAFAVVNPEPVKLVPILDIALEGIGVWVNDGEELLRESSKLEIMLADCSFYLENLPLESISTAKAFPASNSNLLEGRRCSIKFGNLTSHQESELKYFIRNYAQGGKIRQVIQKFSKVFYPFRAHKHSGQSCNTGIWQNLHRPTV